MFELEEFERKYPHWRDSEPLKTAEEVMEILRSGGTYVYTSPIVGMTHQIRGRKAGSEWEYVDAFKVMMNVYIDNYNILNGRMYLLSPDDLVLQNAFVVYAYLQCKRCLIFGTYTQPRWCSENAFFFQCDLV